MLGGRYNFRLRLKQSIITNPQLHKLGVFCFILPDDVMVSITDFDSVCIGSNPAYPTEFPHTPYMASGPISRRSEENW